MPSKSYRGKKEANNGRSRSSQNRRNIDSDEPKAIRNMKRQAERERELASKRSNTSNKTKKGKRKKNKKNSKHPKLMTAIKIFIIIFLLLCVVGAGIIAGTFFGLFGDDFEISKEELTIAAADSVIVDQQGNKIVDLSGDEKRKIVNLEEMADYLPKAYVAIEDERFYNHSGVDFKRTAGAILSTIKGNSSYGGSTITQQLVKNITKDDERNGFAGIMRKVKEWAKAYQVERMISKQQILELYLNILYVGGNNLHGVELGSQYYFAKPAKELDLAECAFLAGINSSPSSYNPYDPSVDNSEKIKNKTNTVLNKMKELGFIENEDEYNAAVAKVDAGLQFQQGQINSNNIYSYHVDATITQIVEQIMEERGISKELAENYVYGSGLKIYSTVNNSIQSRLEEEYKKDKYIISGQKRKDGVLLNDHSQSGMAVVDYRTGYVLGVAGGLGEKTEARGWNRATQMTRQTGSSMKPLAAVAPALEEKLITAATVYDDSATDFGGGYTPKDYNKFRGVINIRQFIETSQNIPALKILAELTPEKSLEYLKKLGITSLKDDEDNILSLAIGGMKNGVSPLEMASAYGTIANGGVHITPTFYTKVEDMNGNVVLTPKQETTRAISEQNAYITATILQEPVKGAGGTATYCAIPGMDVAAKTGTTDDDFDRWLCGFTPYYSAACWYGYDVNEEVFYSSNPAGLIWDAVMTDIHTDLPNATFQMPSGIVRETACRASGCLASSGCGNSYSELFTPDNLPQRCQGHGSQKICNESNLVATEYCPDTRTNYFGTVIQKEQLKLWKPLGGRASGTRITGICDIHKAPEDEKPTNKPDTNTNSKNTANTSSRNTTTNSSSKNTTTNTSSKNTTQTDDKKPSGNDKTKPSTSDD